MGAVRTKGRLFTYSAAGVGVQAAAHCGALEHPARRRNASWSWQRALLKRHTRWVALTAAVQGV